MRRLVVAGVLLSACDSPVIPGRDIADVYAFDLPTQPPAVLRWPAGATVRVFIAPGRDEANTAALRDAFEAGASAWNEAAVFAEYRLAASSRIEDADAVLVWSDVLPPVETEQCRPSITQAVTTFCIDGFGTDSVQLRVFPLRAPQSGASRAKMLITVLASEFGSVDRLVAHELGHVLGIARHSNDSRDLMWRTDPPVSRPTRRDAATVQVLYHTRADIVP
jgi:hypothetical protein